MSVTTYRGIARGKSIELDQPLPFPEGEPVNVWVERLPAQPRRGSPAAIRKAMHEAPHASREAIDEMERMIEEGRLPVLYEGIFDEEDTAT